MSTVVELRGRFTDSAGEPAVGKVRITLSGPLLEPAADRIVAPVPITRVLDNAGAFALDLLATDDPGLVPAGVLYRIEEQIPGAYRSYHVAVPMAAAELGLELADLAPAVPGPQLVAYAPAAALAALDANTAAAIGLLEARIAALEAAP